MKKEYIECLKKAIDENLPIRFFDTFDCTKYNIEDISIKNGVCYISSEVCGIDVEHTDKEHSDDPFESFYRDIDTAYEELLQEGFFEGGE